MIVNILSYSVYGISALYFTVLFTAFILSFIKKNEKAEKGTQESGIPFLSLVLLIDSTEGFIEENLRAVLDQDSPGAERHEYIFIDRTNNLKLLKEIGYDHPNLKKMYFNTPKINIDIIREILEHKSGGGKFIFLDSRDRVGRGWLTAMEKYASDDNEMILGRQLVEIDKDRPHYFRAIDQLFKALMQRSLSAIKFNAYSRFSNLIVDREALLNKRDLRSLSKRMIGEDPDTMVSSTVDHNFRSTVHYKLEENLWKNSIIDKNIYNIFFYLISQTMNILPLLLFLFFLQGTMEIFPMIVMLFAKFIAEGLIISRGARIYGMQALLNDFWSWFFLNPPLSLIAFVLSGFIPLRFFTPKKIS